MTRTQIAQQELTWLKGELQRLDQGIKAKDQELWEATMADGLPALIALIGKERKRLVDEEKDVRQQQSALQAILARLAGIPEAKAIELAHLVMKETVERMVKRMKPTITTTNHEKGDLVIQTATIDHAFFERRLAGHSADVVANLLSSSTGRSLQVSWNQASCEEDVQTNINKLIPLVLGTRVVPGGKYWDTHRRGLEGMQVKIDASVTDTNVCAAPHIVTLAELKLRLSADHSSGVGDAVNRIAQLHTIQQQREHFLVAVIGKDAIQLWWVRAGPASAGLWRDLRPICTNMLPLAMQADSEGLQMLVRWLRTDWGAMGFLPPALPPPVPLPDLPGQLSFTGKLLDNASTHTGSGNNRPAVLVYTAELQTQQPAASSGSSGLTAGNVEVVVKVPGEDGLFDEEVENLAITSKIVGIRSRCIRLQRTCDVMIGGTQRSALVLQPRAQQIPLDITPADLLRYVRSLVDALHCLHCAGYLYCDLSYSNLLSRDGLPLVVDLQTLTHVDKAWIAEWPKGTRLFMALQTLKGGGQSIGTELETVLYVIMYVLLGGVLPWRDYLHEGAGYIAERQGFMTLSFEEQVLAKAPCEARAWLRRMRDLFFMQGEYDTKVTCEQFSQACTLDP